MGSRWISDLVGTFKTSFRIGRAVFDTSGTNTGTPTVLGTTNTGIKIPDVDGLCWIGQTGLKVNRTAADTVTLSGTASGFVLSTAAAPNNYLSTLLHTTLGFKITGGSGTAQTPTYTWNGSNSGTGLSLKDDGSIGPSKFTMSAQKSGSTTGHAVVDISLGAIDLRYGESDTSPPTFTFFKSRGSSGSPIVITTGDLLARVFGKGYVGSTGGFVEAARIDIASSGAVTDSGNGLGADIIFYTRVAAGGVFERLRIASDGIVTVAKRLKVLVFQDTQQTVTFSATPAIDVSLGSLIDITLTGNVTGATLTGGVDGQKITLRVKQDATGSRTWAFGSGVRFGTDITAITLTTAANKLDYIGLVYNSSASTYDVVAFTKGF